MGVLAGAKSAFSAGAFLGFLVLLGVLACITSDHTALTAAQCRHISPLSSIPKMNNARFSPSMSVGSHS